MVVARSASDLPLTGSPVCAAIGLFDGVHLGHQKVLGRAIDDARQMGGFSLAVTFDRHPNAVVAPRRVPRLIQPLSLRLQCLRDLGLNATLVIPFDEPFSRLPAEAFVRQLTTEAAPLRTLSVGRSFTFGHRRAGNVSLLARLGSELGFRLHAVAPVHTEGGVISSTRLRDCISRGEFPEVSALLGRPYALRGRVVSGDRRGRALGFPTANLDVAGLILPPTGVYAARAVFDGQSCASVINIGHRPTITPDIPTVHVEAHVLDFSGDLYGREIDLLPFRLLRREQRFPNLDALRRQIALDVTAAREALSAS